MKILLGALLLLSTGLSFAEERQKIPIPKPFRECKVDTDCVQSFELCGCCDFVAMNKKFTKKYSALERYCKEPPPPCKCTPTVLVPKCVKKLCELVPSGRGRP